MNRTVVYLGIAVVVAGFLLAAYPILLLGRERFDLEQGAGCLVAPVGVFVVMFGASFYDPTRTTVGGVFGNPDERRPTSPAEGPVSPAIPFSPLEAATCRFCRTYIDHDQATCPRCARARPCRRCGRPLGRVLDRATCPRCGREEAFCDCSTYSGSLGPADRPARARWR